MGIDTFANFGDATGEPIAMSAAARSSLPGCGRLTIGLSKAQILLVSRSGTNFPAVLHDSLDGSGIAVVPFDEP